MKRYAAATLIGISILISGCEPKEQRPGLWLSGEVVEEEIVDWSFTDDHGQIFVETATWYVVPHSVTTVVFRHGGSLFVPSRNPGGKRWVSNVTRDPAVRLKIGDRIYLRRAIRVTNAEEIEALYVAIGKKYDRLRHRPNEGPELWFFRMDPPEG